MGWFTKATGWLLGSKDMLDRKDGHLKNLGSWVGNLNFTAEEMAEMDAETAKAVRQFAVDTLSENTDRSKTRRELAIFIVKFYALLLFLAGMLYRFDPEWAGFWLKLAMDTEIGWLVLGVGAFFWGSHTLRTARK